MAAAEEKAATRWLVLGFLQLAAALLPLLMGAVARPAVPAGVLELADGVGLQLAAAPVRAHLAELLQLLLHLDEERT